MDSQACTAGIAKLIGYESVGAPPCGKSPRGEEMESSL